MKKKFFKRYLFVVFVFPIMFSCTSKENRVREFVEQDVLSQAEDYLICQAILKYVQNEAMEVLTNKINYYANNPYYDYSYFEKDLGGSFMALALASGGVKKKFDERWNEFSGLYIMLSHEGNIEYGMHQIDSTLKFRDLLKENNFYSIEDIADIYFKPNHLKFTEITPKLYESIYRSMLCLGAATYKYDVVDEIRVKEKEENLWTVDLVYHSGYCMNLEIGYSKEIGFFTSKAPWLPEVWGEEDDLWGDEEPPSN